MNDVYLTFLQLFLGLAFESFSFEPLKILSKMGQSVLGFYMSHDLFYSSNTISLLTVIVDEVFFFVYNILSCKQMGFVSNVFPSSMEPFTLFRSINKIKTLSVFIFKSLLLCLVHIFFFPV